MTTPPPTVLLATRLMARRLAAGSADRLMTVGTAQSDNQSLNPSTAARSMTSPFL
jgi:hypothetical protein